MLRSLWLSIVLGAAAAILAAPVAMAADARVPATLIDQGWSKEIRELFYFTPQGSRTIPYAWFMALETIDGKGRFADLANLQRYGFIPADGPHPLNPGGLPIGFAIDPVTVPGQRPELGFTCAACHTANVTVEGRPIRIDGGPANVDFDSFYADLSAAVTRTFFDQRAFQRFAAHILTNPTPTAEAELLLQFAEFQTRIAGEAVARRPTLPSGFGRVDAMTQIVNSIAGLDQLDPNNLRPVNAPTSYPHLWLTPELEFVQWTPIAGNAIARNGGEVLGVFGAATLTGDQQGWYDSSILLRELHSVETWVADLKPPKWDEALFGPINRGLVTMGETLYRDHCAACHSAPPYRRTDPAANLFGKTFIEIGRVDYREIGTDSTYIDSFVQRLVRTNAATAKVNEGRTVVPAAIYLVTTSTAILTRAMEEAGLTDEEKTAFTGYRLRPPATPGGQPQFYEPRSLTDFKAGPLPGIWATGPYLHNGSVPTVYELLSPEAERRAVFWTGGRELDRQRLGFVSDDVPGRFRFDTSLPGNRKTGHLYPAQGLTHDERMAIIEYLKTL